DGGLMVQHLLERVHTHAVLVERRREQLQSELSEDSQRADVFEFFHDDGVTRLGEGLRAQVQALVGATGNHDVVQRWTHEVVFLESLLRHCAQLGQAPRLGIVRQLMAAPGDYAAGSFAEVAGREDAWIGITCSEVERARRWGGHPQMVRRGYAGSPYGIVSVCKICCWKCAELLPRSAVETFRTNVLVEDIARPK